MKLKLYNTNCRIHVQHAGKASHHIQPYLMNKSPPKFFAEEVILPFCKIIGETISKETEKELVIHMKKEIQRLKKAGKGGKGATKNRKGKCVNNDCRSSNNLDPTNVEKYGKCGNCQGFEHYRCASIDTF